ncbi:hypothetical protein [Emticicia soli]|uniref:Uncharacterized protein n=1 Tax=Emticicia soli TaxID=2027878 RepID=A0ABW5J323_9BACT
MLRTLKFACVLLVALGCKREYAHFQTATTENFHKPKNKAEKPIILPEDFGAASIEEITLPTMPDDDEIAAETGISIPLGNNQVKDKTDLFPRGLFKKKSRVAAKDNNRGLFKKQEKRGIFEKKKKRKKRDGFWHGFNERLKIGLVLLGIAIIFALLHINILAIIFGIFSAFFIIRGLRKLF